MQSDIEIANAATLRPIVEVAQEAVTNAGDVQKRVDQVKKDGKKSILLTVANANGELRFVALNAK